MSVPLAVDSVLANLDQVSSCTPRSLRCMYVRMFDRNGTVRRAPTSTAEWRLTGIHVTIDTPQEQGNVGGQACT